MIGKMRHRFLIQKKTTTTDDGGGQSVMWQDLENNPYVWGALKPMRPNEELEAEQITQTQLCVIKIRYRSDVVAGQRLKKGVRYFRIMTVYDITENERFLELTCEEMD